MSNEKLYTVLKFGELGFSYPGLSGKTKEDFGTGKPYVPYMNVFKNSKIDVSFFEYVTINQNDNQNRVNYGDLLFTTSSETVEEVGMTAVLLDNVDELYLNSFCFGFRLYDFNKLLPEYASYLFRGEKLRKQISLFGQGSTRYNLPKTQLFEKLEITVPTCLDTQRHIAEILTTTDTLITQTEAVIAKYKSIKQGMLHDLFTRGIDVSTGKLRPTPQQAPHLYKESELGLIPREWEVGVFIDFADNNIQYSFTGGPFGSDLQSKDYTTEGIRIIQLQNIGDGEFNDDYKIFTTIEKADYLKACNIYPGEIILSKMAEPIARACLMPNSSNRFLMASDGIRLSIDKKRFNTRFVLETINHFRFRRMVELKATGSTRSRIGLKELKYIQIVKPSKEEQDLVGTKLDTINLSIETEMSILEKYMQIKKGLMKRLLEPEGV